ncbi:hypothetical protein Pmani_011060 [Petrolisthes manimaculis]|uniref:Uncharacterized protein n=1 Tax=Petrolisthes manimaculis TaxID=1843537 RepID=A0AAE1Q022_9EUCA|nr:hypothetical protein Pmani_011060 [Petrolisthes manimaculis]
MSGGATNVLVVLVSMLVVTLAHTLTPTNNNNNTSTEGHRQGFLWVTGDKKLRFPTSSILIVTPTLSLPTDLDPQDLTTSSSTTISVPFKVNLDDLGVTQLVDTWTNVDVTGIEEPTPSEQAGGQRAVLYRVVETWSTLAGVDGHQCLLKLICQAAHTPVHNAGLLGEMLQVFLTPSKSPDKNLKEYLKAEQAGQSKDPSACQVYQQNCPYSFY